MTLKAKFFAIGYVKDGCVDNSKKAKKYLKDPEVQKYIQELQDDITKTLNLTQTKQIQKLQDIADEGMKKTSDKEGNEKPVNLSASISAIQTINQMAGLDKPKQKPMELPDDMSNPAEVISATLKAYSDRLISKEDVEVVLKSLDTVATFKFGSELQKQLQIMGLQNTAKTSIFNRPKVIEHKESS